MHQVYNIVVYITADDVSNIALTYKQTPRLLWKKSKQ